MGSKEKSKKIKSVDEIYVKMTPHEHILALPDTYVGSIELDKQTIWKYNRKLNKMEKGEVEYNPGLYKLYDEIIVNARDHSIRDKKCKNISVWINRDDGEITVMNDGDGIPVEIHPKENMYVPEMIFGNLLTSSNYNVKGKTTGGKNGYGAKLVNIFSTDFWVETICSKNNKYYKQHFYNNMYKKDDPIIRDKKKNEDSYTKITFRPDFARFGMTEFNDDMIAIMEKRVYDLAACTPNNVKVFLNDVLIDVNNFKDYISMFYEDPTDADDMKTPIAKPVYSEISRWKVGVVYDQYSGYNQISYVNGICTFNGGTHVNHVTTQVVDGLYKFIKDKHKNLKLKTSHIKDNITVFIDCVIEDPSFSSQVKDVLTSKITTFGSRFDVSDDFIKELSKTGIVDAVVDFAKLKELSEMKKSDGKKRASLRGYAKLEDADWAGKRKSDETRLILTEGDSAKTYAMSGREIIGTEKYGVFPLRGKMLNVRDATSKQLLNNEEIKSIKQIMGLKQGKKYTSTKDLRYGGIIILVDQDTDGSHIKGLIINFIHFFWPSLLKLPNFIQCMATPIIKAFKKTDTKKSSPKIFYTLTEYRNWIENDLKGDMSKWIVKYYKGLGTSTDKEAKEAFDDFDKSLISYVWSLENINDKIINKKTMDDSESESDEDEDSNPNSNSNSNSNSDSESGSESDEDTRPTKNDKCNEAINLAFAKPLANQRKVWLKKYNKDDIIENNVKKIPVHDFVHRELIHFSNYDNFRSIPALDGLKPSQRKIVYASFLRKLDKEEVKVAQLSGFVSDKAEYHHGEVSLQGAIINMAQNFIGSNNINLLTPNGNFGTRREGGKDASSARYIFTQFNPLVQYLFRKEDECILKPVVEDGKSVEPIMYPTIIPLVLINGVEGIGTGFSTNIPSFNPKDIIANIRNLLDNKEMFTMIPWYYGYKGEIKKIDNVTYETIGKYEIVNDTTVKVTELPIKTWTKNYKEYLESITTDDPKKPTKTKFVVDMLNHSGNNTVDFQIEFARGILQKLIKDGDLEKKLKLRGNIKISNMHLYNENAVITKYSTVNDILKDFFKYRLHMYEERKKYYVKLLEIQMMIAKERKRYIEEILDKKIIIERKKRDEIIDRLVERKFSKMANKVDAMEDEKSYEYLTSMALFSLTQEKIEELENIYNEKMNELEKYKKLSIRDIWKEDLNEFESAYDKWIKARDEEDDNDLGKKGKGKVKGKGTGKGKEKKVSSVSVKEIKKIDKNKKKKIAKVIIE